MSCDASVCSRFGLAMNLYVAVVGLVCIIQRCMTHIQIQIQILMQIPIFRFRF